MQFSLLIKLQELGFTEIECKDLLELYLKRKQNMESRNKFWDFVAELGFKYGTNIDDPEQLFFFINK